MSDPVSKTTRIKAVCATPKIAYRLEYQGKTLGFALSLSNGLWSLFDVNETRLSKSTWVTPQGVARGAEALGMHT